MTPSILLQRSSAIPLSPFALAGLVLALICSRAACAESDNQLWSELKLTEKWTDRFDLIAGGAFRLGQDFSHHDNTSGLLGLNVHAAEHITLTPSYQFISRDPVDDVRSYESRFGLVASFRLPVQRFETTLSTGIEYRLRHEQTDSWRFRPRLKIKHAAGPKKWGLAAYAADELFYETGADTWTRNRLFVGIEKQMRRNWVLEVYYCRQQDLRGGSPDLNIIGISMRLSLDHSASDPSVELPVQ